MEEKKEVQGTGNRKQETENAALDAPFVLPFPPAPVVVRSYRPADYPVVLRLWEQGNLKPFTAVEIERLMGAGGNALVAVRPRLLALEGETESGTEQKISGHAAHGARSGEAVEEAVVGVILWSHNGSIGILWRLAVDPNARGLGIATRLLDRAEQEIRELGLAGVSLLTRHANEIARGMYARRGYKWSDHLEFWGKRLDAPEEKPGA